MAGAGGVGVATVGREPASSSVSIRVRPTSGDGVRGGAAAAEEEETMEATDATEEADATDATEAERDEAVADNDATVAKGAGIAHWRRAMF
jgi:hypothetical protein